MADHNYPDSNKIAKKQFDQEIRRIKAANALLKRNNLDIFDQLRTEDDVSRYQSVLALWQNEAFQADLEQSVLTELAPDPGGIRRFLADFEAHIEDLDARWLLALWRQESGQSVGNINSLLKEYQEVYTWDLLKKLAGIRKTAGIDPITQRQLHLWHQVVARELVDVALEPQRTTLREVFASYSFHLNGKRYTANEISAKILREEPDRTLRHKAWENLARLSQQVEPMMQKLLVRTNALWQKRGYENANAPRLQTIGVSEGVVRQVIANCERASRHACQKLIDEYEDFLGHKIEPWDWRFAARRMTCSFERIFESIDVITCIKKTYERLGLVIDQLPIQITESPTIYSVFRYDVRIPHDILLSYGPLSGFRKFVVLLRELGKACCFAHIDGSLAYPFRRYTPLVLSDALGALVSWIIWEPGWLQEFTNLTADQIAEFIQQMKHYELLKMRLYAGLAMFEIDAYTALAEDAETDLNALYNQHMEKFLLLPHNSHLIWASEPRYVDPFPRIIQYLLALAVAANLADYFQRRGNRLLSPQLGELFRSDLVQLGNASSWLERLQQLTSRTLTPFPMSWSTA